MCHSGLAGYFLTECWGILLNVTSLTCQLKFGQISLHSSLYQPERLFFFLVGGVSNLRGSRVAGNLRGSRVNLREINYVNGTHV